MNCNKFNKLPLGLKMDAAEAGLVDDGSGVDGKIVGGGRGITSCPGKEKYDLSLLTLSRSLIPIGF